MEQYTRYEDFAWCSSDAYQGFELSHLARDYEPWVEDVKREEDLNIPWNLTTNSIETLSRFSRRGVEDFFAAIC